MRGLVLLSLMFISTVAYSQYTDELSLKKAIQIARENNRTLDNSRKDMEIAKKKVVEAISKGLPQIFSEMDYQDNMEIPVQLIPSEIFGGAPGQYMPVKFGQKYTARGGVTLTQKIFDGSYIVGLQSAKLYKRVVGLQNQKTDLEIRKIVIEAYVNVLLAERNSEISEKNLKVTDSMYYQVNSLYEAGFVEEESKDQLSITKANLVAAFNSAIRMKSLTRKILALSMGVNLEGSVKFTDTLEAIILDAMNISNAYFSINISQNINYQLAEGDVDTRKALVKLEYSSALPTINGFFKAQYNGFGQEFSFFDKSQNWFPSVVAGVSIKIPIFSSFNRSSRVKQSKLELYKSENKLKDAKEKVFLELEKTKSEYLNAVDSYSASKQSLQLAERILKRSQIKFSEGIITSLGLQQAQEQLYGSQSKYLRSIQSVILKKSEVDNILNKSN